MFLFQPHVTLFTLDNIEVPDAKCYNSGLHMTLVIIKTLESCATCGFMLLPGAIIAKTTDGKCHHRVCSNEAELMPDETKAQVNEGSHICVGDASAPGNTILLPERTIQPARCSVR